MSRANRPQSLPPWMRIQGRYTPLRDRAVYIDKTILAVVGVLSRIRYTRSSVGALGNVHPALKITGTAVVLLLLSLSRSLLFVELIAAAVFLSLSTIAPRAAARGLAVSATAAFFALVITAPSILQGNVNGWLLAAKVGLSAAAVTVLAATTTWHRMTAALKLFFIPDVFILVFDIAIRYIYLLGEFSLEMLYALKLRSVGKNDRKHHSLVQMLGSLFLKSKDMAEEMYGAMECRGFSGRYTRVRVKHRLAADIVYAAVMVLFIAGFLFIR